MSYSSHGKCCLNCAFWQGYRTQRYRGVRYESEHPSDRGQCAQRVWNGCSQGHCACEGRNCDKFVELPYK